MKKTAKRLLSMLLAFCLVLGLAPVTALATETGDTTVTDTAAQAAAEAAKTTQDIDWSVAESVNLLKTEGVEIDEEDPAIISVKTELDNMMVLGADEDGNPTPVPLTEEEKQTILAMYQQYLDQWEENANLLGVQMPFFLQYNDSEEDGLGALGEMLALSGIDVATVRAGYVSYDDLTGMIMNFYYGDQLGLKYYGSAIASARDEALEAVEESGAKTEAQKLLVLNDWLAHNATFDMSYIMNADKEEGEEPMVAPDPQTPEHYDDVYNVIYEIYEDSIRDTFEQQIEDGLKAAMYVEYYKGAIESAMTQSATNSAVAEAAKDEDIIAAAKKAYWQEIYDAKLEELKDSEEYEKAYNASYNEYLDKNCEHEFEQDVTWTEKDGVYTATADLECKNCGRTHENVEAKSYKNVETAATCTEGSKTTRTATFEVDGYTFTADKVVLKNEDALGHDYDDDGICTRCKAVSDKHVHNYATEEVTKEATCTEKGEKTLTCACGAETTKGIDALGHDYDTNSTCTRTGCGYVCKDHVDTKDENGYCDECGAPMPTKEEDKSEEDKKDDIDEEEKTETETVKAVDIREDAANYAETHALDAIEESAAAAADEAVEKLTDEEVAKLAQDYVKNDETVMENINKQVEEQVDAYMEQNNATIEEDPNGFCKENFGDDAAAQFEAGWADFWADCEENGIPGMTESTDSNPEGRVPMANIVSAQMDTPMDDLPDKGDGTHMTPNEAIPVYAQQAAAGLTDGIMNYWEGTQIGILGQGTGVCLGYTKTYTYLVQYMHPEVYGTNGANTDLSKSANWKTAEELYYTDGKLDINKGYVVDAVRITFDASVTMYGETQDNFNSDHFWNAVLVDDQWYYVDPCYTDVYTEVMMRDRVETDGDMNHLYFLFSHDTAADLYDGNYSEIKTLYEKAADSTDYEDSWISRIKSNTYSDGKYFYYSYDSTDLISMLDDYNNSNGMEYEEEESEYKIVRHKITDTDKPDVGDTDYEALIEFNYKENEDDEESVARFLNADNKMEESELLTKLYAQHVAEEDIYPSLALTSALYDGKIYFNLSNCILSYDLDTCEVVLVKEYNTIYGKRDDTVAFGGMAFSVVDSASSADFTVYNRPITALTIKADGTMYVSVATNFAFISGKDPHNSEDQDSYGYEFEESNYNPDYNSYTDYSDYGDMMEMFGYSEEINDNDEFMWAANFVETLSMSHLAGTSHKYSEVTVDATCGRNGYTENRCTTCGAIEDGTRVEVEDSACAHHYVYFEEEYYTKDDNEKWNTGSCYVCVECNFHIEEPTEPTKSSDETDEEFQERMDEYEKEKAIYDEAVATAGHTYVPTDAKWASDYSTVTFSELECSAICPERKNTVDCLLEDDTISLSLSKSVTADAEILKTEGLCTEGVTITYGASGEVKSGSTTASYTVTTTVTKTGKHEMDGGICEICGYCAVNRVAGEDRYQTAIEVADQLKATLGVEKFDAIILAYGKDFPDALAGSYLATVKNAPILLYRDKSLDLDVAYIEENLADNGTVYILGSTAVISADVEKALSDYTVKRLSGDTRYETNLAILEEAGVTGGEILVCTGRDFADSLSASAVGLPILLVNSKYTTLTDSQIKFLEGLKDAKFTIVGSTAAVNEELATALEAYGTVDRVYGDDRYETSVAVAERYFPKAESIVLAYSRNFPDGLCGGPLAYAMGAPLILTKTDREAVATEYVEENEITGGLILGSTAVITEETAKTVFGITSEKEIPSV